MNKKILFILAPLIIAIIVFIFVGVYFYGNKLSTTVLTPADCGVLSLDQFITAKQNGQIVITITPNFTNWTITAVIVNNSCGTAPVSFSNYKMFDGAKLSTQVFYDGAPLTNVLPGQTKTFTINISECSTQVDFWYGQYPTNLVDSNPYVESGYVPHFIAGINHIWGTWCTAPTPTPTPTPTSTPTATPTPTQETEKPQTHSDIVTCYPKDRTINVDTNADFISNKSTAAWSAIKGTPSKSTGLKFATKYNKPGNYVVTASADGEMATCKVKVSAVPTPAPTPTPAIVAPTATKTGPQTEALPAIVVSATTGMTLLGLALARFRRRK